MGGVFSCIYNKMKRCYKCQETKSYELFSKNKRYKDGRNDSCKECVKKHRFKNKQVDEIYRENNKDYMKEYSAKYWVENKEKIIEYQKLYYADNLELKKEYSSKYWVENKERLKSNINNWKKNNPNYYKDYMKKRYHSDLEFKIISNLRSRFYHAIKGNTKSDSSLTLIGCSIKFLQFHIWTQFDKNMNWENHGSYWELDHIKPCALFDLSIKDEQKKCFHYTNLQPLKWEENRIKGKKYGE